MNWKKLLLFCLTSYFFTILDVSFFSNFSFFGATIVSAYIIVLVFALVAEKNDCFLFLFLTFFFYAIFSSVPIIILFILFVVLPGILIYLRKYNYVEPTLVVSSVTVFVFLLLFELILLIYYKEFNFSAVKLVTGFVLVNSLVSLIIFDFVKIFQKKFSIAKIEF